MDINENTLKLIRRIVDASLESAVEIITEYSAGQEPVATKDAAMTALAASGGTALDLIDNVLENSGYASTVSTDAVMDALK